MISNGARATAEFELGGVDRDAIEARFGAAGRPTAQLIGGHRPLRADVLDTAARKTALSRQTTASTVVPSAGSARHVSALQRASYSSMVSTVFTL